MSFAPYPRKAKGFYVDGVGKKGYNFHCDELTFEGVEKWVSGIA